MQGAWHLFILILTFASATGYRTGCPHPVNPRASRGRKESAGKPGSVVDSHSSEDARRRAALATYPEASCGPHGAADRRRVLPYLVLLPVGFAVPPMLPPARCALTAPFHPCRRRLRGT